MAECLQTLEVCQGPGERWDYAFNLTTALRRRYELDKPYSAGQAVVPSDRPGTGFEYLSGVAGGQTQGKVEPNWEKLGAGPFADGSQTWTRQAMSNASLKERIDSVVWDAPDEITVSDQVEVDSPGLQEVRIWVEGGEEGETYEIVATITMLSGARYQAILMMSIADLASS